MIDYKELLIKYIEHVVNVEGEDFIPATERMARGTDFSDDDLDALWALSGWDPKEMKYVAK
jgi:hypothetical protein